METAILRKWLNAGYVENGITYPSHKGTPQGGIIICKSSPSHVLGELEVNDNRASQ